jgi:hypothetical protein
MTNPDTADPDTANPRPRRRGRAVAWSVGWVLLALISFCVTYALLVVGGR